MSILEKLPASYKFTEADVDRGCEICVRYVRGEKVTDEEMELSDYAVKAWDMYQQSKCWPTVSEVTQQFECEEQEKQKRREQSYATKKK